jgi:hypothetical protein
METSLYTQDFLPRVCLLKVRSAFKNALDLLQIIDDVSQQRAASVLTAIVLPKHRHTSKRLYGVSSQTPVMFTD